MTYFVGIDVSTTATKALLMGADGKLLGVAASEYTYETPKPLWTEQHPNLWRLATVASLRQVLAQTRVSPAEIKGVGLTGQMHGLVLLDAAGEVLRPAILWNDQRTGAQCDEIRERLGKAALIQITGNDALTGFTAPRSWGYAKTSQTCTPGQPTSCCPKTTSATGSPASLPPTKLAGQARFYSTLQPATGHLRCWKRSRSQSSGCPRLLKDRR